MCLIPMASDITAGKQWKKELFSTIPFYAVFIIFMRQRFPRVTAYRDSLSHSLRSFPNVSLQEILKFSSQEMGVENVHRNVDT